MLSANKRAKLKHLGFTLIELLLVISILGVMASLGLVFLQKRATQTKIERSALQMQQVFEAAMVYYNDNAVWPEAFDDEKFVSYLPLGLDSGVTPWGRKYRIAVIAVSGASKKFRICTPSLTRSSAMRLQSMLPSAVAYKTGQDACGANKDGGLNVCSESDANCEVASDIINGEAGAHDGIRLVRMGDVQFSESSELNCPKNTLCETFNSDGTAITTSSIAVICKSGEEAKLEVEPYVMDRISSRPLTAVLKIETKAVCNPEFGNSKVCNIEGIYQGVDGGKKVNLGSLLKAHYYEYCLP